MKPTQEQQQAIDAFLTQENLTIEAGAGTGKTSTLKSMSAADPHRSGLYIAYNAAIAKESQASFPNNVECRTAHSVAYRWTAKKWGPALRARLNGPRVRVQDTARLLGSNDKLRINDDLVLAPTRIASIAMNTIRNWCYTGDFEITAKHVERVLKIDSQQDRKVLADAVVPMAKRAWMDLSNPKGNLKFAHDHYLKLWALSKPVLNYDFILVDEAQDSNGVVTDVVRRQVTQVAAVGDRCQAIYGWRGATDAMDAFNSQHHVFLSQSFRFGERVAEEANKWLAMLEAKLRLTGNPGIDSKVGDLASPKAILCRTNAEAVSTVIGCHADGTKVHYVGGGSEVSRFAQAAGELMANGRTSHHDLFPFTSWSEVQQYVEEAHDGGDLAVMVKLIDRYGPRGVEEAIQRCAPEASAEIVVSTAHKAKGREWDTVRIADDFDQDSEGDWSIDDSEAMLAYVGVTRARYGLDLGGLAWINSLAEATMA